MNGRRLCVVKDCGKHRADDTWTHVAPRRTTAVTAHLQQPKAAA